MPAKIPVSERQITVVGFTYFCFSFLVFWYFTSVFVVQHRSFISRFKTEIFSEFKLHAVTVL